MERSKHDRREHPREPLSLDARISTIDAERDPWDGRPYFRTLAVRADNVSRGGVFVHTGEPIAPGRRVLVEIDLPEGGSFEAVGRVVWSRRVLDGRRGGEGSGVAVQFIGGAGRRYAQLERCLAAPRKPEPDA